MSSENSKGIDLSQGNGVVSVTFYDDPVAVKRAGWIVEIKKLPEFKGNIDNAAILLQRISQGISLATNVLYEEGEDAFVPPGLAIAHGEAAKKMSAMQVSKPVEAVAISQYFLEHLSLLDFSQLLYLKKANGETVFEGFLSDFGLLMGLEETHHASYFQKSGSTISFVDGAYMPNKQYDSVEHEFQALLFQLKVAKKVKLHSVTVNHLQNRVDEAIQYRSSLRL